MQIEDQVALVTGAASGLGRATAEMLSKKGARVVCLDMSDNVHEVAKEINGLAFQADVTSEDDIAKVIKNITVEFGAPRIVVNCAGICPASRTVGKKGAHSLELFKKVIDVNLIGSFNVLRLAAEAMSEAEELNDDGECGVIINTASVAAYEGQIGQSAYSASKGGIVGMTLPIARDLTKLGIRIMAIAPGIMMTPMVAAMPEEVQKSLGDSIPYPKRLGNPDEFASLVCSIAENAYMNGSVVRLDGAVRMTAK